MTWMLRRRFDFTLALFDQDSVTDLVKDEMTIGHETLDGQRGHFKEKEPVIMVCDRHATTLPGSNLTIMCELTLLRGRGRDSPGRNLGP